MEQSMFEQNLEEHGPLVMQEVPSVPRLPSYHPTAWAFVNRVLDIVDTKTGGRAAWCQRFFMFAFIGGFAALVNMTVFYLVFYVIALPVNEGGNVLTFVIQFTISHLLHMQPIIAQAIALILVLFYNFSFHHIFTYRHIKPTALS